MTGEDAADEHVSTLPPDEAFAVLGNESRINIITALGDAAEPLPFSDLYDKVDIPDSGQFSYHLNKLQSHFVQQTDDEYELTQAGLRVIEAVLSGAITEPSVMEPDEMETPCPHCGGTIEAQYDGERVLQRCLDCAGGFRGSRLPDGTLERGYLPPAGLQDRTLKDVVEARATWNVIEQVAMINDVCPRCAGHVDHAAHVCEQHTADGLCDACNRRKAVLIESRCQNCPHENIGYIMRILFGNPTFRAFFDQRGLDLFALPHDSGPVFVGYEEEILASDPFTARFTFTLDDDRIRVTVDDELSVVEITYPDT